MINIKKYKWVITAYFSNFSWKEYVFDTDKEANEFVSIAVFNNKDLTNVKIERRLYDRNS